VTWVHLCWSIKGVSIATQLNSTRHRVELRRYRHFADETQLKSMSSWVELCRYRQVSIATQRNSTQLTQLNSIQPSQSCFCLWHHDLQTESTGSLRSLIGDSCSRCERVDNSTSSRVELCRYKHPLSCLMFTKTRLLTAMLSICVYQAVVSVHWFVCWSVHLETGVYC